MKNRIMMLAVAIAASASFSAVSAQNVDATTSATQQAKPKTGVVLKTEADSVSYAAGKAASHGVMAYLERNLGIKPEQMPDVIRGFRKAVANRNDSVFNAYAAGLNIGQTMNRNILPSIERGFEGTDDAINDELLCRGFADVLAGDESVMKQSTADEYFATKQQEVTKAKNEANKAAGEKFLAENKKKPGVITLPSGLQYKVLKKGTGSTPKAEDQVTVVYEGRTIDGHVFDATSKHGTKNDSFAANRVIKGWTEALTMMPVGSKWEVYIPSDLAYGERGAGDFIKPFSTLIFDIELQGFEPAKKPEAPAAKAPAKKAPAKAAKAPRKPAKHRR